MTTICKYCREAIAWDTFKKAYLETNGQQHKCEGYFNARKIKDSDANYTDDLLLQILNELMAIRTILGAKNNV